MSRASFQILPGVVPANRTSALRIVPRQGHTLCELGDFALSYRAHENLLADGKITADIEKHPLPDWHIDGESILIEGFFAGEQEHSIDLIRRDASGRPVTLEAFRIYSLSDDLRGMKPYRGNFHQHSANSPCCHAPEDTPPHVAAESRRIGLDFTTISDHSCYRSVQEAEAAFRNAVTDLVLFPGEEVHPMQWSQHIVNFGGKYSITELLESDRDRFFREVEEIRRNLHLPDSMEQFVIPATQWAFAKIREAGGLAILAHPYWYYSKLAGLMVSPAVTEELIRRGGYDAMEVVSGFHYDIAEYNNWQIVRWFESRAEGRMIPPLGVNDSHCCRGEKSNFDWYSTVIFAESLSFEDVRKAVLACRCAALETLPGAPPKVYGDLRFVKYIHFLLREYFPEHDAFCRREGKLMEAFLQGKPRAAENLSEAGGQTEKWRKLFFGELYRK